MESERPRPAPRSRPPQPDHAGALLLNMIRTLTTSTSDDQKELDRRRLEMGFAETSDQIDQLVIEHQSDVETCLESFKNVSSRITASREKVHSIRTSLLTCRSLLQCRRDDLKRLWMENAQQKHVSKILAQIDAMKKLGGEVEQAIASCNYHTAANLLKDSDLLLNGPFSNIDGLNFLRSQLQDLSKKLAVTIVNDLTNFLIVRPFEHHLLEIIKSLPENKVNESAACANVLSHFANVKEEKSSMSAATSLQCSEIIQALLIFNRLSSTLKRFLDGARQVFAKLVWTTTGVVCVAFDGNQKGDEQNLSQYMNLILCQFRSSYEAHQLMDAKLKKLSDSDWTEEDGPVSLIDNFWECAQGVLEDIVEEYITKDDLTKMESSSVAEKISLFRFEASACSVLTHTKHAANQMRSLICPPSSWNITVLYPQLERFCNEREAESGSKPCRLRKYLHLFIVNVFIDQFKCKLETLTEQALNEPDAWRHVMQYPNAKVLASCWNVFTVCEQIGKLIIAMDKYTERLSALWLLVIDEFAEHASNVYEKVLNMSYEDENHECRKISAAWAVDEDISRLLKSLPNWCMISGFENDSTPSITTPSTFLPTAESESEVCQRNERESEIFIGNLGTAKQLVRDELITDVDVIRSLACMHESVKWFCNSMRSLIGSLSESSRIAMQKCIVQLRRTDDSGMTHKSEENIASAVERRLLNLDTMADTCLLIIHLELRVHCFYHLLPLARVRPSLPHDELDNEVVDFGRDIAQIHQTLRSVMPLQKMNYLFDGLGHLSASIFIHSSQHIQKLSDNGKKRVCRNIFAVQQRLSQLTGRRESELERARAFFELLNHDPDQLFAQILERGAVFTHLEYTHLLALAIRSHPVLGAQPGALEQRIAQLKTVLSQNEEFKRISSSNTVAEKEIT